jgi:hypothetical protein
MTAGSRAAQRIAEPYLVPVGWSLRKQGDRPHFKSEEHRYFSGESRVWARELPMYGPPGDRLVRWSEKKSFIQKRFVVATNCTCP